MKALGVARYNLKVHFDYHICGVLMHWSMSLTKSSDDESYYWLKYHCIFASGKDWCLLDFVRDIDQCIKTPHMW